MIEDWSSNLSWCLSISSAWVILRLSRYSARRRKKLSDIEKRKQLQRVTRTLYSIYRKQEGKKESEREGWTEKGFEVPETRQGNETWFRTAVQKSPKRPSRADHRALASLSSVPPSTILALYHYYLFSTGSSVFHVQCPHVPGHQQVRLFTNIALEMRSEYWRPLQVLRQDIML